MENDKTLHNWINKTIKDKELENFKKRSEYNELDQLWEATEGMQGPGFNKEAMLKEILATPKSYKSAETKVRKLPVWLPLLAAASVVLFLTFTFYPRNNIVELATVANEEKLEEMADGSKLTLYGNSQLNYDAKSWDKARNISLSGSAKFEVAKGNAFTVSTNYGQIEVLGTIFTAKAEGEILEVFCTEGKVRVSNIGKNLADDIETNESIKIIENKSMVVNKSGLTKLENAYLEYALAELGETFKVTFEINEVNVLESITCNFPHNNLQTALKSVLDPLNIKYELNEAVVYLSK